MQLAKKYAKNMRRAKTICSTFNVHNIKKICKIWAKIMHFMQFMQTIAPIWNLNIWKPDPVHKSPFFVICFSYACRTNIFFISLVVLSYPCHILVTTKLRKDIPGIYTNQYQTSKKYAQNHLNFFFLVYTKCIFSGSELHVPVVCLAYPCHNFFQFPGFGPGMQPTNEIQQVIDLQFDFWIPLHRVHHAQQDLFATGAPVGSFAHLSQGSSRGGRCRRPLAQGPPVQGATEDRCDEV